MTNKNQNHKMNFCEVIFIFIILFTLNPVLSVYTLIYTTFK